MTEPSVKGSIFLGAVVDVRRLREKGRVSQEKLEKRLSPGALSLLDQRISVSAWYPVQWMSELLDLDWEISADRAPEYQRKKGEAAARYFAEAGTYQQISYADRERRESRERRTESQDSVLRRTRLVATLNLSLYNFLETQSQMVGADELQVIYDNAQPLCEALRYITEGFLNGLTGRTSRRWSSRRVSPGRIVFSLNIRPRN